MELIMDVMANSTVDNKQLKTLSWVLCMKIKDPYFALKPTVQRTSFISACSVLKLILDILMSVLKDSSMKDQNYFPLNSGSP